MKENKLEITAHKYTFSAELQGPNIYIPDLKETLEISGDAREGYFLNLSGKTYRAFLIKADYATREFTLRINNRRVDVQLKDNQDWQAEQWGIRSTGNKKCNELRSPMPGMVLQILVQQGDILRKGDPLIILEAMKMENILRAPADVTVKSIRANEGTAVDKNQLLLQFQDSE
jgi:biotin carboxyl carrier protein